MQCVALLADPIWQTCNASLPQAARNSDFPCTIPAWWLQFGRRFRRHHYLRPSHDWKIIVVLSGNHQGRVDNYREKKAGIIMVWLDFGIDSWMVNYRAELHTCGIRDINTGALLKRMAINFLPRPATSAEAARELQQLRIHGVNQALPSASPYLAVPSLD